MRIRAFTLLALIAMAGGTGCVAAAVDQAITQDMRAKDPTACVDGRVWRRSAAAPQDCLEGDEREACEEKCRAPGE